MMAVGMLVAEMTSQHAHDGREIFSEPQNILRPSLAWHPLRQGRCDPCGVKQENRYRLTNFVISSFG
jgi:hypothetical protein